MASWHGLAPNGLSPSLGVPRPGAGAGAARLVPRLIEPCRTVTLERSDRVHGKSRHKGATPPNAEAGVKCVVWGVG